MYIYLYKVHSMLVRNTLVYLFSGYFKNNLSGVLTALKSVHLIGQSACVIGQSDTSYCVL